MDTAKQTIWHKAYERALKTITSLRNHCDFKYDKDATNANKVIILNAVRPTVKKYTPGEKIEREAVSATSQELVIDQFHYFNIGIDDIVKAQTVPGALESSAEEGALALSEKGDEYVATIVKDGVTDGTIHATPSAKATKSNALELVEDGFEVLYGNNCKVQEEYWLEIAPSFHKVFRPALTEVLTNNVDMAKKGVVGRYGNALVTIENMLPSDDTDVYNILRTKHAIAFVEQIRKTKTYEPEDGFEQAIKALYAFGAKLVREKEIVVIKTQKA